MSSKLAQGSKSENRQRRSIARYCMWGCSVLVLLIFLVDVSVLLFIEMTRSQTATMAATTLPRSVAAQRLAVDASHLTALTAELSAAASIAERQTVMQRIDGLRSGLAGDIDMLKTTGLNPVDLASILKSEQLLLDGADAMNGVAQSGIDLRDELTRQKERAREACNGKGTSQECQAVLWALAATGNDLVTVPDHAPELKAVAVLQHDLAINEQRRANLLRRQSEIAAKFLALASSQSDDAAEQIRHQQGKIVGWARRIEWLLGVALFGALAVLLGLRLVIRRRARLGYIPEESGNSPRPS